MWGGGEEGERRNCFKGGSPGLVVMGDDSCSKGRGFESRCHMLDGIFVTLICCKNCVVCLKRPKINKKEAGVGPFKINCFKRGRQCPVDVSLLAILGFEYRLST